MSTHSSILLIDDSPGECELFRLALKQTGLDVALFTEQDAEAAFHFLQDRSRHRSEQALHSLSSEAAGVVSTARTIPPAQPSARQDALFPERGQSATTRSASTETMPAVSQSSISLQEGDLNWSPTARIEGAHSDRAASASKGDQSGHPPSLPSLILLDLHLRGENGCDFLKRLRADGRFAAIPVVIFTTSDDQQDVARCYASGANGYVVKPGTFAELIHCTGDLCRFWLDRNRVPVMIGTPC
ncbi:response regulator [Nitrospira sp. NS4]|uniref:response regulator n=1 Tax=Nitrospira sp. NS4 TaxID=3414498 RepID=UPI003C2ABE24